MYIIDITQWEYDTKLRDKADSMPRGGRSSYLRRYLDKKVQPAALVVAWLLEFDALEDCFIDVRWSSNVNQSNKICQTQAIVD